MVKYSHMISFYFLSCKEINYIQLHESTLYPILKELKLSPRHSLAGLDDMTADV